MQLHSMTGFDLGWRGYCAQPWSSAFRSQLSHGQYVNRVFRPAGLFPSCHGTCQWWQFVPFAHLWPNGFHYRALAGFHLLAAVLKILKLQTRRESAQDLGDCRCSGAMQLAFTPGCFQATRGNDFLRPHWGALAFEPLLQALEVPRDEGSSVHTVPHLLL